jgi:thioredoxin 1
MYTQWMKKYVRHLATLIALALFPVVAQGQSTETCSEVVKVNEENFEDTLKESWTKPVLVTFGTPWCGACRLMEPSLKELAERLGERAIVTKVDAQESIALAERYGVRAFPTTYLFRDGRVVKKSVGALSLLDLEKFME